MARGSPACGSSGWISWLVTAQLGLAQLLALLGCSERGAGGQPPVAVSPTALVTASAPVPTAAAPPLLDAAPPVRTSAPDFEQADLDPTNDALVAPPEPLADCRERLTRAGVEFRAASLPLVNGTSSRGGRSERIACGAEQVVTYLRGPAGFRYNHPPLVTCRLGLALARFEQLAVEQGRALLKQPVVGIEHLGMYSCRKMVRFDFVSEHSYANAIDIRSIVLADGQRLSVARDFGALDAPPSGPRAEFLRSLARRAFDERLFSNVLTPFWDAHHHDHFHLDLARYRVDGTGPRGSEYSE